MDLFSKPSLKLLKILCITIIIIIPPIIADELTTSLPNIFNMLFIIVLLSIFPTTAELNNSLKFISLYTLEEYSCASCIKEEMFNELCWDCSISCLFKTSD